MEQMEAREEELLLKVKAHAPWLLMQDPSNARHRTKCKWVMNMICYLWNISALSTLQVWCTFLVGFLNYMGYVLGPGLSLLLVQQLNSGKVKYYYVCVL